MFRKLIRMPLLTLSLLLSLLLLLLLMPIGFGPSGLVLVLVLLLLETYRERKKSVNKGTKEGEEGTTKSDLRRPLPALVGTFPETGYVQDFKCAHAVGGIARARVRHANQSPVRKPSWGYEVTPNRPSACQQGFRSERIMKSTHGGHLSPPTH